MSVYYNENDKFAAAWLRELIKEGLIADGEVDERSIEDVKGSDLGGFTQHHFFAGIGGWSYALRLAGWDDSRAAWTGSCPCQPFSAAGKRQGVNDKRHLWPQFHRLISECAPPVVFGEQVASKDGRLWLAGVRSDLEALGYAVGAADLCAAGVGAPHIRQRLYWVADAYGRNGSDRGLQRSGEYGQQPKDGGIGERLADTVSTGWAERRTESGNRSTAWGRSEFIQCADGKARRIEPGIQPLAHGVPNRMGTLRGSGNAIVPQVAAEFVKAYLDILN